MLKHYFEILTLFFIIIIINIIIIISFVQLAWFRHTFTRCVLLCNFIITYLTINKEIQFNSKTELHANRFVNTLDRQFIASESWLTHFKCSHLHKFTEGGERGEGGVKLSPPPFQKKLPSKSPTLLGLTKALRKVIMYRLMYRYSHHRYSIKKCSEKFCNFYRKTLVLESHFNKARGLKFYNIIKKRLQHRCFPMNTAKFLRTTILENISERFYLS